MAYAKTWNSVFDTGPAKTEKLGRAYIHINDVRVGVRERMALDHEFDVAENASQGAHKQGSARAFYQASPPNYTQQTAIPSNTLDLHSGRIWIDSANRTMAVQTLANANAAGWMYIARGGGYELSGALTCNWTVYSLTADHEAELVLRKSRLATAGNGATADNDDLGSFAVYGNSGTGFTEAFRMQVRQDGTAGTNTPTEVLFILGNGTTTVTPLTLNKDGTLTFGGALNLAAGTGLTVPNGLTVTAGGLTVTAGGLTVTAGGLTVTAGNTALPADSALGWASGDVTITHSTNALAFAGASSGYSFDAALLPATADAAALGSATLPWGDVFLASGGVLNWGNGDVTATHSANALAFSGASSGYSFDASLLPATDDGGALGSATLGWSDVFLASGAVMTWGAPSTPDATLTHSADLLTLAGADLSVPNLTISDGSAGSVRGGTYTPTITVVSGGGSLGFGAVIYTRVGPIVSGYFTALVLSGTITEFRFTLPISSDFTDTADARGLSSSGVVSADTTNNAIRISIASISVSGVSVSFWYIVK